MLKSVSFNKFYRSDFILKAFTKSADEGSLLLALITPKLVLITLEI